MNVLVFYYDALTLMSQNSNAQLQVLECGDLNHDGNRPCWNYQSTSAVTKLGLSDFVLVFYYTIRYKGPANELVLAKQLWRVVRLIAA